MINELYSLARELENCSKKLEDTNFSESLDRLEKAADEVGKSWSKSWLGYHSRVYYDGFVPPPAGAHFSQEWGFQNSWPIPATVGDWREFTSEDVINVILQKAGNPDLTQQERESQKAREVFEEAQAKILSNLSNAVQAFPQDKFLGELNEKAKKKEVFSARDLIETLRPRGSLMTRDMAAMEKGVNIPPHITIIGKIGAIRYPFMVCAELSKIARRAASHLSSQQKSLEREGRIGTKVFIGHGRSALWKDLKDFIQDRLRLPWDEFNRVPIAGVTNVARLSQMLDEAAISFLIMTGEDEQVDGSLHARMNVVHEAGLFQGRLGFQRAIILFEEGCEEFSNIQGLGQIRFPRGNIKAIFEDVRQVLEREKLLES